MHFRSKVQAWSIFLWNWRTEAWIHLT